MNPSPPTEAELQFYYIGLHKALKRYRTATLLGWVIVAAGVASVPLGWSFGQPHGTLDLVLAGSAIVAGLALVYQSVVFLDAYVSVQFPSRSALSGSEERSPILTEIDKLIQEIKEGGWQDAYAAIGALKQLGEKAGLPGLER